MIFLSNPSKELLIPMKFVTAGIIIYSLHQVFANPGLSKSNILVMSPISPSRFEDFCCSLNILLLQSPPNLNGLNEQLIEVVKRKPLLAQGVKEIPNSLQFKPKVIQTEINLDTCDFPPPWNLETPQTSAIICPTFIPDASEELENDLRCIQRLNSWINNSLWGIE
ncbi:unnamed protein product [Hymenolepis diminuta]|uniref:Uncharacterized protein n=1 Tax=Hymenolepis diminuta TaxID=6216 RepID=A0A564Z2G9_HYMDI|nr:unnamed protein product [Hymenolepis diminuta]